jgi:hypothetical protein
MFYPLLSFLRVLPAPLLERPSASVLDKKEQDIGSYTRFIAAALGMAA